MTERVEKPHLIETIKHIRQALNEIEEDVLETGNTGEYWLMTLLCRIGELETCIELNNELRLNPNADYKPNRLCTCYEKSESNFE
mgnify:CR=1 FL=1